MDQEFNWKDIYAPEDVDCSSGLVPPGQTEDEGQVIRVAEGLVSMKKKLFDRYRLQLYSCLNEHLRNGSLRAMVGFPFTNTRINREVCEFTQTEFRLADREHFTAYVLVTLKLNTPEGKIRCWKGYLGVICSFEEGKEPYCLVMGADNLADMPDGEQAIILDRMLIPYLTSRRLDMLCEEMWEKYIPGASTDPQKRDPVKLAEAMGLSVQYLPVYRAEVNAILFFEPGTLLTKADKNISPDLSPEEIKKEEEIDDQQDPPTETAVPARTIVVNTNQIAREYAAFAIYHECFHHEFHYLFYRLQGWRNNDTRMVPMTTVLLKPGDKITDPLNWAEKQAKRGAYGLMMPGSWTEEQIQQLRQTYREVACHDGDLFDRIGRKICCQHGFANFQLRARMIQLGHIKAKGALNWIYGEGRIEPFDFDPDSCPKVEETFVVDRFMTGKMYEEEDDFRRLIDTGRFIYADGHIARNDPRFVEKGEGGWRLTTWANAHVDQCCLRFERVYIQNACGYYVFGRMNLDEKTRNQLRIFLADQVKAAEEYDEPEELCKYRQNFPEDFWAGVKLLMRQKGVSQEELSEALNISTRTFQRWMEKDNRIPVDLVIAISLVLQLPDLLSRLLLDRAGLALSEKKKRDLALSWILRMMWDDGIETANKYLRSRGHDALSF